MNDGDLGDPGQAGKEARTLDQEWESAAEHREERVVEQGSFKAVLRTPKSRGAIVSAFLAPSKTESFAGLASDRLKIKVTSDIVNEARFVRICIDEPPSDDAMYKVAVGNPGLWTRLVRHSQELCGLFDPVKFVEDSGN